VNDKLLVKLSNKARGTDTMFKGGNNVIFVLLDIGPQQTTRVIGYGWRLSSLAGKVWIVALETNFVPTILSSRLCRYWMYDSSEN
jgi:hypothetical protein